MKLISLGVLVSVMLIFGCGPKKGTVNGEEYVVNATPSSGQTQVDQIALGEALVKGNDCNTCHHKVNTVIGPAHLDVAKKYQFTKANIKLLAEKIMKGGSGVWGQIPMTAHVDINQADAEAMSRYILSLDGETEEIEGN